jgi:hypothetical protein
VVDSGPTALAAPVPEGDDEEIKTGEPMVKSEA